MYLSIARPSFALFQLESVARADRASREDLGAALTARCRRCIVQTICILCRQSVVYLLDKPNLALRSVSRCKKCSAGVRRVEGEVQQAPVLFSSLPCSQLSVLRRCASISMASQSSDPGQLAALDLAKRALIRACPLLVDTSLHCLLTPAMNTSTFNSMQETPDEWSKTSKSTISLALQPFPMRISPSNV